MVHNERTIKTMTTLIKIKKIERAQIVDAIQSMNVSIEKKINRIFEMEKTLHQHSAELEAMTNDGVFLNISQYQFMLDYIRRIGQQCENTRQELLNKQQEREDLFFTLASIEKKSRIFNDKSHRATEMLNKHQISKSWQDIDDFWNRKFQG